jgi:hypothetical protein
LILRLPSSPVTMVAITIASRNKSTPITVPNVPEYYEI